MVLVGVGIASTSLVFQTNCNLSQLPNHGGGLHKLSTGLCGDHFQCFLSLGLVHKQIFLPFRTRFGVVAKQDMIQAKPQQLLRCKQWHAGLFRRSITFSLIAFYACSDKVGRGAFAALCTRQNVIEREVLRMFVVTAILAPVTVSNIDAGTLHRSFAAITTHMHVMSQADYRRHGKGRRRGMKNIVAIVFLDKNGAAKPQANRLGNSYGAERLVRKVQKQNSPCKQTDIPPSVYV